MKHHYPPILFEAWDTHYYQAQKEELLAFLQGLGYEILQIARMDYIAQHSSSERKFKLLEKNENSVTYQMSYNNS